MAHEMWKNDSAMYGSGKAAWHRHGTVIEGNPTTEEAIRVACMDWMVETEPVFVSDGAGGFLQVPDWFATCRNDLPKADADRALGMVRGRYHPIQNLECFGIGDALLGESGARWETAGTLKNGRIVYMTAILPEGLTVKGDHLNKYLLIRSSHDGSCALEIMFTPVRVVCWNTLTWAISGAKTRAQIRHTTKASDQIAEAKRVLFEADQYFESAQTVMQSLARTAIDDRFVTAYLKALYPDRKDPKTGEEVASTRMTNKRDRIAALFNGEQKGADHPAIRGTAYGLLNAVAEYIDHDRTIRVCNGRTAEEARLDSVVFGTGARERDRAVAALTRLTGIDADPSEAVGLEAVAQRN